MEYVFSDYFKFCEEFNEIQDTKLYEKLKGKMGNSPVTDKDYYFLTINPRPDIDVQLFLKTILKALSKRWITYYEFVLEQRSDTEDFHGVHTHIIFNKGIKHCKVVLEMKNSFKHMCDCSDFHYFNLKNIDNDEMIRKTSYILDRKADPEKWPKQDMDILFRAKHNLQKSYKSI